MSRPASIPPLTPPPSRRRIGSGLPWTLCLGLALAGAVTSPAASAIWRWSNPQPHGANIFGLARGQMMTVQVGERGQIYTSADLVLWEPRTSPTRRSLRSAAFLGPRLVICGERGLLLYSDDLEIYEMIDLKTEEWLEGVATSTNLAVAVGDRGAVYTSGDGIAWHPQKPGTTADLRGIAHGAGSFVAVGKHGFLMTSRDGTNWTRRTVPTQEHLNAVAWLGQQFLVAGDGGVTLTSPAGGLAWTLQPTLSSQRLLAASGNLARQAVAGERTLQLSYNGDLWLEQTDPSLVAPAPAWTYYQLLTGRQTHFAVGRSGMMVEGFQTNDFGPFFWGQRTPSIRNWLWEIKRLPDFYVTVGTRGTVMTSENGRDWNLELVPPQAQEKILLGVGGDTNLLLAVGEAGEILISPNLQTNLVQTNRTGRVVTNQASTLGLVWHGLPTSPTSRDLQGVATFQNQYVLCGDRGTILSSPDGTNWTRQSTPTEAFLSSVVGFPGGLVASGEAGTLLFSPQGESWRSVPFPKPTANWLFRVRWTGQRLVVTGQAGSLYSSRDGLDWVHHPTGIDRWLYDILHLQGAYFLVGNRGTVLRSPDLVEFRDMGVPTGKSLFGLAHDQEQIVVAGVEGAILRTSLRPNLEPVRFLDYDRRDGQNLFLIQGDPDQRIVIEETTDFQEWTSSRVFEFLDETGTLLILDEADEQAPPWQFYRAVTLAE